MEEATETEEVEEATESVETNDEVSENYGVKDEATGKEGNFFTNLSTPVKIIMAIVAICCIGAIIFVVAGMLTPGGIHFSFRAWFHTEIIDDPDKFVADLI